MSGGLRYILSPTILFEVCPNLFWSQSLIWASVLEPIESLSNALDNTILRRKQLLRFQYSDRSGVKLHKIKLPHNDDHHHQTTTTTTDHDDHDDDDDVALLEHLWIQWNNKIKQQQSDNSTIQQEQQQQQEDLHLMLPLPDFLTAAAGASSSSSSSNDLNLFNNTDNNNSLSNSSSSPNNNNNCSSFKRELLQHVLIAFGFVLTFNINNQTVQSSSLNQDLMISYLLELLFKLHSFDSLTLGLAIWIQISKRKQSSSYLFRRTSSRPIQQINSEKEQDQEEDYYHHTQSSSSVTHKQNGVLSYQTNGLLVNIPRKILNTIHTFLDRLKNIADLTEDLVGFDLAESLALQLTRKPLPSLSNRLPQIITSSKMLSVCSDLVAVESFVSTFDAERNQLESGLASACLLWMVCHGAGGTFPRPLTSLQSPYLTRWLDSVGASCNNTATDISYSQHKISSIGVSIAVAEFFLKEKNYSRAFSHFSKLIEIQPGWLTFPIDKDFLLQHAATRPTQAAQPTQPTQPAQSTQSVHSLTGGTRLDNFPTTTLDASRGVVGIQVAEDFRQLFSENWMVGFHDHWTLTNRFYRLMYRLGDLPVDVRTELVSKAADAQTKLNAGITTTTSSSSTSTSSTSSSHQTNLRRQPTEHPLFAFTQTTHRIGTRETSNNDQFMAVRTKLVLQKRLLYDLLEFLCLLIDDPNFSPFVVTLVEDFERIQEGTHNQPITAINATGSGFNHPATASDPIRPTLLQNIMSFVVMTIHMNFPNLIVLFDAVVDFIASLRRFAPFNATILLEICAKFPPEQKQRILSNRNLINLTQGGPNVITRSNLSPTIPCIFLGISTGISIRNAFFLRTLCLGFFEELGLRYWNIFGNHSAEKNDRLIPSVSGFRSSSPEFIMLPCTLFLFLDRTLRINFAEKASTETGQLMDKALNEYFSLGTSSHAEKLRRVNSVCANTQHTRDVSYRTRDTGNNRRDAASLFSAMQFERVLPVDIPNNTLENRENCGLIQPDNFKSPIGSISGFAYDVTLRVWLWDLVGLTRDVNTGEKIKDSRVLTKDPTRCLAIIKPVCDWLLNTLELLQHVTAALIELEINTKPGTKVGKHEIKTLLQWLDSEAPIRCGPEEMEKKAVQHLTAAELAYLHILTLGDLFTVVAWFSAVCLPCFQDTIRLTSTGNILMLREMSDTLNESGTRQVSDRKENSSSSTSSAGMRYQSGGWSLMGAKDGGERGGILSRALVPIGGGSGHEHEGGSSYYDQTVSSFRKTGGVGNVGVNAFVREVLEWTRQADKECGSNHEESNARVLELQRVRDWRAIAEILVHTLKEARANRQEKVIREILKMEGESAGWHAPSTSVIQLMMMKISHIQGVVEGELLPGLQTYVKLFSHAIDSAALFGPIMTDSS